MHIISKEFGSAIRVIAVILLILAILFGAVVWNGKKGIRDIGGSAAETGDNQFDATTYQDTAYTGQYGVRLKPEITYDTTAGYIKKGTEVNLMDYFVVHIAEDGEAGSQTRNEYPAAELYRSGLRDFRLEVLEIKDRAGNSVLGDFQKEEGRMVFHKADIYTVTFELIDGEQKYNTLSADIPAEVN